MSKHFAIAVLRLGEYLHRFGLPGIALAFSHQRKYKRSGTDPVMTQVPEFGPVYLRPATSDLATFREIFVNGEYDFERCSLGKPIRAAYDRMVGEGRTPVIFDVGANVGLASIYLSRYFPRAQFVLVEANPASASVARINGVSHGDWEIHETAIWDHCGQLKLTFSDNDSTREVLESAEDGEGETVSARTAAEILGPRTRDLLIVKMDIEGAERRVLHGDDNQTDWLENGPLVMIEPHDGIFNPAGSLAGLLDRQRYREGMIVPNGTTILFVPEKFASLAPESSDVSP